MLPAPITSATSTPRSWTRWTCRAIAPTLFPSMPYSSEPIMASPESLSRIRSNAGSPTGLLAADREAREALDDDVLAELAGQLGPDLLDRLALVLVGVDVRLRQEGDLLEPLAQLALGDLRPDVLRLVGRLLLEDAQLGVLGVLRDLVLGDPLDRRDRGDVPGAGAREVHEVAVAGDEVRVAVDLDEDADLGVGVDVGLDRALGGLATAELQRLVAEAHAEQL